MAHDKSSFNYKVINEDVRKILDSRSRLNNSIQVAMPFVRATTTIVNSNILKEGNIGFTLGIHNLPEDIQYEDMYAEKDSNMPLVGYTYQGDGTTKKVYAMNPVDKTIESLLDRRKTLYTSTDYSRVPPPGLTNVRVGTNKNGLLSDATLTISVPTLVQLETLHRVFLVPGLGMVVEWGQQFAPEVTPSYGEISTLDTSARSMFPWNDPIKARQLLSRLAVNEVGIEEILNDYVYPSQGQYMWIFGRVGSYTTKANSDGSYECTVRIIGTSENSWAYSVKDTVVSTKKSNNPYFCASNSNSVYSYFTTNTAGKNFKSLLDETVNPKKNSEWKDHVFKAKRTNNTEGEPKENEQSPIMSEKGAEDLEDAYYITWRFFVNKVLNDEEVGLKSIFKGASLDENEMKRVATLLPYASGPDRKITNVANIKGDAKYIDDPYECFVGFNKYLRSTNPGTMLIINEEAASLAEKDQQYNTSTDKSIYRATDDSRFLMERGKFEESTSKLSERYTDRGFLSAGIWINHKVIVECMSTAESIIAGIRDLLGRMNIATENYWNLTIDAAEPIREYGNAFNYMVVDSNFKESSDKAVQNFLENVYTFNKYISEDKDGNLQGSETTECSVDLSLPKRMFAQIGTIGLIQPEDIGKTDIIAAVSQSKKEQAEDPMKISDPNDSLRQMFSLLVLSSTNGSEGSNIDLTILPKSERDRLLSINAICADGNTNTTAETAGVGYKSDKKEIVLNNNSVEDIKKLKEDSLKKVNSEVCKKCSNCSTSDTSVQSLIGNVGLGFGTAALSSAVRTLTQLTIGEIRKLQSERKIFAVGKYQGIPATLNAWITSDNISASSTFSPSLQEKFGDWLLTSKRPKVKQFIDGGNISVEDAQLELAKEFASIPIPYDIVRNGVTIQAGQSYYAGSANNKASHSITQVRNALFSAKNTKSLEPLKQFIAKGEGSYEAINRGKAGDTPTNSPAYKLALNSGIVNGNAPTSSPLTKTCNDAFYESIGKTTGPLTQQAAIQKGKELCAECEKTATVISQVNKVLPQREQEEATIRKFYGLQSVFRYVEIYPEYMVNNIAAQSNGVFSNSFGAAPGMLAINADLSMPGVNGLRVGELFWIDRVPSFYKAFGAFQIMSIEHTITTSGWQTKIHAVFNYLGRAWLASMRKILGLKE